MKVKWNKIRENQFPALKNMVHLKAAGGSPISMNAYQSAVKYFNDMLNLGDVQWDQYINDLNIARKKIAKYFHSKPSEIAFLINTSSCMNLIARLLRIGEVLYPEGEFPASIHIFKRLNFHCRKINQLNFKYDIKDFKKAISQKSKYIIHSHVQYLAGFRQNLKKLGDFCKNYDLKNIINATQSFGAFPINVRDNNIDMLVASAIKWACCGYGIGILYINERIVEENELPFTSWLSVHNAFSMDNDNLNIIKKTQSMDGLGGTPNFPALLSLKGGLELIEDIGQGDIHNGINAIYNRITYLTSEFLSQLRELNYKIITPLELEYRSGIITVEHKKASLIYEELLKENIYISLRNYPNSKVRTLLRFSIHYYNNLRDIDKTISVLKRFK
jgi:selenocysteine lyase/cysteine desulfurase